MSEEESKLEKKPGLSPFAMFVLAFPVVFVGVFSTWPAHTFTDPSLMGIIVSFKKITDKAHLCDERELAEFNAAAEKRLKHMRGVNRECGSRERVPLKLAIWVDGAKMADIKLPPSGIHKDSACYIYQKFLFPAGERKVKIAMSGSRDAKEGEYEYEYEVVVKGESRSAIVVSFDSENNVFKII
ncbi:MAG: hypothetical protein HQK86_05145 [Nitrospinae bacterium]|nr:hypothetical protein [Nitrospinota bacterium]